jgi:YgiT-type zinc finger domain-containing protein
MWREKMAKSKKTKIKANCPACDKGILVQKMTTRSLDLDGAPIIELEVPAEICSKCDEVFVSDNHITLANQLFLQKLLNIYLKNPAELPGKVATWMRKEISLSARELAQMAGLEESTLSHAHSKNSFLDRFAATVLLLLANDKVKGTTTGANAISKMSNLEEFWGPSLRADVIVAQVKSLPTASLGLGAQVKLGKKSVVNKVVTQKYSSTMSALARSSMLKKNPYHYALKKTNHKR